MRYYRIQHGQIAGWFPQHYIRQNYPHAILWGFVFSRQQKVLANRRRKREKVREFNEIPRYERIQRDTWLQWFDNIRRVRGARHKAVTFFTTRTP